MKCNKCGGEIHPGDQICMTCGAKLSLDNTIMPEVDNINNVSSKPSSGNKKKILIIISSILIIIIITIFIVKFLILR